jgi:hypothetical protein
MYARSTTLRGEGAAVERLIDFARDEVLPALQRMSGNVGLSMLADRDSGRCILTSAWADDTSMHATEQSVVDFRRRAAEIMGGDHEAHSWEIAVLHRAHLGHDGARTRVLWSEGDPARVDDNLATFRTAMLPRIEELPGFCSVSLLVDRQAGRSALARTHDSRVDLEKAAEAGIALQQESYAATGERMTDVADFDLVLHRLRVPETV